MLYSAMSALQGLWPAEGYSAVGRWHLWEQKTTSP